MKLLLTHKLLIGAVTLVAAASAGAAYAATQSSSDSPQAFVNDVAKRLNVSPAQLNSAFRAAWIDQLNAAVKAGKLTQAQANRIEQRLRQGLPPRFFGFGREGRFWFRGRGEMLGRGLLGRGPIGAAASYLGLSDAQLISDLSAGKSMAQLAKARGKSVSGLEQAIIGAERSRLDRLVGKGLITTGQEQRFLSALSARVGTLVNRTGFLRLQVHGPGIMPPNGPMLVPPTGAPPPPTGVVPPGPFTPPPAS